MTKTYQSLETKLIHAGEPEPRIQGAVVMPIFQSATFTYEGETSYDALRYIRLNNTPNHIALQRKLAAIEGAEAALVTGSGMAAISTTLLTVLRAGDHLLAQRCLYGGTHAFVTADLPAMGVAVDFIDADDPSSWAAQMRPTTRAIYVETLTNPLLELGDLLGVVAFARARGIVSLIDNTFASPVNFRPIERGFDLSIHSCTKYLNGHSDIVAGAVIGKASLVEAITHKLNHLGGCLNPETCSLLHRGMKTLALRMAAQSKSALELARMLSHHPLVSRVNYPGLESHPRYARARELLDGFGGMLSFELRGGVEAAEHFLRRVTIPLVAPSLGGVETLVIRPAVSSHAGMSEQARRALGINDGLIRLSVGVEATSDLIEDFQNALEGAPSA
jgi:cystathionine beta-lyase/cystathionine gamma-synthase